MNAPTLAMFERIVLGVGQIADFMCYEKHVTGRARGSE